MIPWEFGALALAVTATMAAVDFAHSRYALAMCDHHRDPRFDLPLWRRPLVAATGWSLVQWLSATVAFFVAVRVSMWFLPFEGLGLAIGNMIGGSRRRPRGVHTT